MKTSSFALAAAALVSAAAAESQYTTFTISSGVTQTFTLPSWPTVSIASSAGGGGAPVVTSAPAGGPATYNTSAPTTTTFVTAGASGLNVEGSVTGLVVFCVLSLFML